jgi:predicted transcriptional regulator
MDTKRIILRQIASSFVTGVNRARLIMDLEDNYRIPSSTIEPILYECLTEGLISVRNSSYYDITQEGLDFLNNESSRKTITPINTQLNPSQKSKFWNGLWKFIVAIICSLIAAWIWDNRNIIMEYFSKI